MCTYGLQHIPHAHVHVHVHVCILKDKTMLMAKKSSAKWNQLKRENLNKHYSRMPNNTCIYSALLCCNVNNNIDRTNDCLSITAAGGNILLAQTQIVTHNTCKNAFIVILH